MITNKELKLDIFEDLEGLNVNYVKEALKFLGFNFAMTDGDITSFTKRENSSEIEITYNTENNRAVNLSASIWKEETA